MSTFHDVQQNTPEWLELRRGKFTASAISDLFMGKTTAGYNKAIFKCAFERMTGEIPSDETYQSAYMKRGHDIEEQTIQEYERLTFNKVHNGGFYELNEWVGASPDGRITNGIVEAKSPAYNTQMGYLIKKTLPSDYLYQVHSQMLIADVGFCDFFTFHPQLPIFKIRVIRDPKIDKMILDELGIAITRVKEVINQLKK